MASLPSVHRVDSAILEYHPLLFGQSILELPTAQYIDAPNSIAPSVRIRSTPVLSHLIPNIQPPQSSSRQSTLLRRSFPNLAFTILISRLRFDTLAFANICYKQDCQDVGCRGFVSVFMLFVGRSFVLWLWVGG